MAISYFDIKRATLEDSNVDSDDLHYSFRSAKELGHLTTMTSLRRLNISFNEVSSLRGIQTLQQLQHINVSHNALCSLDPITALTCLTSLNAGSNRIVNTSALQALPSLKLLALHGNAIEKPSAVLLLSCLTSLQHLTLASNPVCQQQDWQKATIGALPWLQALDSLVISEADKLAAQLHADAWHMAVEAGDLGYSSSQGNDSARQSIGGQGRTSITNRQLSGRSEAGRQQPQQVSDENGTSSLVIKDAAAMLPSITKQQLKPSTVRPSSEQGQQQPSRYGYSRTKPIRVTHQQRYEPSSFPGASSPAAVAVNSDGTASTQWPDGSMAASLDVDDGTAAGAAGSTSGYRLLAMYRSVVGVAASFDSNGGFVQYPNGGLMLVWNRKDGVGTCYGPDGGITHSFNSRKKSLALKQNVSAQLDQHYSINFTKDYELQVFFNCDGCQLGFSLIHGAIPPEGSKAFSSSMLVGESLGERIGSSSSVHASGPAAIAAATAAAAAASSDTQALLARARALMATEHSDIVASSKAAVDNAGIIALADVGKSTVLVASPGLSSRTAAASAESADTAALLARARALMVKD